MLRAVIAAALALGGSAASAGGLHPCVVAGTCGGIARSAVILSGEAVDTTYVTERGADGRLVRRRIICPYPWRPSDSVLSRGSGYIVKDDVRRAMGCAVR